MSKTILIVAVVVAYIAAGTNALECYICTSATDANCADPFSASNIATDTTCTACSKAKIEDVVTRSCGLGSSGCVDVDLLGITTTTCTCTDALCNGGNHMTVTMGAMLLGTAVVLMKALF
ncbi:hypothetical protein DPMN_009247 [Dreissena polymorpha]|uniref:Protein sleepless n=1 Tax=Dreissena polymorpha TaxID=45954 RepID=A0A9D4RY16_DREPO|nr:hypothetical protein DPMN_009247 [Dreissena polymorpha]